MLEFMDRGSLADVMDYRATVQVRFECILKIKTCIYMHSARMACLLTGESCVFSPTPQSPIPHRSPDFHSASYISDMFLKLKIFIQLLVRIRWGGGSVKLGLV